LRPKTSETASSAYKGKTVPKVGAQHENRRAAMFEDEDYIDSKGRTYNLRTRDCLNGENSQVRYEGC